MATPAAERIVRDLADTLEVPVERYESTDRSYRSLARWLERDGSRFHDIPTDVYVQGSFRLGTAIRPVDGDEHYDLDVVCEFSIPKTVTTQRSLQENLGHELISYADAHGMQEPSPWDRCWTLNYADEAQFHMDVLPCVPDAQRQRRLREERAFALDFVEKSVAITDTGHPNYNLRSEDWPVSNPNGYAEWFYERMKPAFEKRRRAMALLEAQADVADIPAFRVKTPLQSAIQILKRHRDVRFSEEGKHRPSSIIITTLAAHAYGQEADILGALHSILQQMDAYIEQRDGEWWISNPSDPRENFADYWNTVPERHEAFMDWLDTARTDFRLAANTADMDGLIDVLAPRLGRKLVETAAARSQGAIVETARQRPRIARALRRILDAPHRRPIYWPVVGEGDVRIVSAAFSRTGFRPSELASDGAPIPRGGSLQFDARTNVPPPFQVYWQVVNTGAAAAQAEDLRGGFQEAEVTPGLLSHRETTRYPGAHSIECFIVKNGYCVASSGPFIVNIA